MVERILGSKAPLYGRSTLSLKLKAISPEDVSHFFPLWPFKYIVYSFVITGGVPYYLMRIAKYKTFQEAVREEFFSLGGALLSEPYMLLYPEVRNVDSYMEIMSLIADGVNRTSKITDKAGISQALCSAMLRKHNNLSFAAEKKNAVINTKVLVWEIEDNFLAFWFRYVYPAQKAIELDNAELFFQETISQIDEFVGKRIEETIRKYIVNNTSMPVKDYGSLEFSNPIEKKG